LYLLTKNFYDNISNFKILNSKLTVFLADRTQPSIHPSLFAQKFEHDTQYDRLLASYSRLSVCLSVTLFILAKRYIHW